jgi:hypothetical protein
MRVSDAMADRINVSLLHCFLKSGGISYRCFWVIKRSMIVRGELHLAFLDPYRLGM